MRIMLLLPMSLALNNFAHTEHARRVGPHRQWENFGRHRRNGFSLRRSRPATVARPTSDLQVPSISLAVRRDC